MKNYQHLSEDELLHLCLEQDRRAQKALYEKFGPRMKMLCLRYVYEKSMAEDVMNRGFLKVFTRLSSFQSRGSFEGWMRRIIVNECLDENKKNRVELVFPKDFEDRYASEVLELGNTKDTAYLLKLIDKLPLGYRTVFNMVEIDGFSHKEVALKLKISESASRSQLTKAKKILRKQLEKFSR